LNIDMRRRFVIIRVQGQYRTAGSVRHHRDTRLPDSRKDIDTIVLPRVGIALDIYTSCLHLVLAATQIIPRDDRSLGPVYGQLRRVIVVRE
jgi:hypothetical protein